MRLMRQQGLLTVEFAVVAGVFFLLLFMVLEIGRLLLVWNTLVEVTRRGAQMAAICPMDDPAIVSVALFNPATSSSSDSPVINGLSAQHIQVRYLDQNGADTVSQTAIAYVEVSISGYRITLNIPYLPLSIDAPPFTTLLPRESLGVLPDPDGGAGAVVCS